MYKSVSATKYTQHLLWVFIFSCLTSLISNANAQETKYTSFLWEITGKGLTKPSYLLGSVHLKDRRLINSNDSIFVAIANTDALALEVHPDTLYKQIWDFRYSKKSTLKKIALTEVQKKEFVKRYQKEYGVMPDSQQMTSPLIVKYLLNPSNDKPDDITAVLDAYLYGLAKSQRKYIVGLEPIENQLDFDGSNELVHLANKNDSTKYYKYLEDMMQLYSSGDLAGVWNAISPHIDLEEMQRRNNTMLKNIILQLDKGTLCAVVGAAHLAGDLGLIHLLQNEGYKLRPVKTKKTDLASKYKIDFSTMEWMPQKDSIFGYTVQLPKSYIYRINTLGATNIIYGDLSTETELMVSAQFVGDLNGLTAKEILKQEYERKTAKSKFPIVSQQFLEKDGAQGMQLITAHNGMEVKWEFWLKNNTLYSLSAFTSKSPLDRYLSDRFFNGFTILPLDGPAEIDESVNDIGAFAIKMPTQIQYLYQTGSEQLGDKQLRYGIHNYFSMDRDRKINYMVQYHDYPIGYIMTDRSLMLKTLKNSLKKNLALTVTSVEPREKENITGMAIKAQLNKSNLFAETWVRGNRIYQVLQENLDKNNREMDSAFFNSFRMVPFKEADWKDFTVNSMKLKLPATSLIKIKNEDVAEQLDSESHIYAAADSNSSTSFLLEITKLPKYYRLEKTDSLYAEIQAAAKKKSEKMVHYDTLRSDNITAAIYTSSDSLTANYHKKAIWIRGNISYGFDAIGTQETVEKIDINRIIRSVRYTGTTARFDVYSSKAATLFEDIYSADSLVSQKAKNTLELNYKFDKNDLALIYKTLVKKQVDDEQNSGLRRNLIYSLVKNHDERSIPLLKNILKDPTTPDLIKIAIFPTIYEIDSTQLEWYLQALNHHRPDVDYQVWQLLQPLRASHKYVAENLEQVIPLFAIDNYRPTLLNICLEIAKDSTVRNSRETVKVYLPNLMKYLAKDLSKFASEQESENSFDPYWISDYVKILGLYDQKDSLLKYQHQLLTNRQIGYLRASTATEFLVLGLPLNQKLIDSINVNISQRGVLMRGLKEKRREDLIAPRYKEQIEIGKIVVNDYMESEWDMQSQQIDYLGQLTENNKKYLVYAFKTENDEQSYLSIYLPDDQNKEWSYTYENCYSDLEPIIGDWKEQARKLIQQMRIED
ncbi:TraB/GumN family protein [Sphingobacterium siyangense]|jgi:uncharacterized protein YbaP (TraB family)|uniref:TraB/GumN family protein n=1 Tax=Sphingobacterium siyangense TaxID=459529 RepID=UPI0028B17748|nr:TraB/GumN family protein [Sphingobacterium siyangense]